ncbi:zwei Ig domain protein zig-8-like isoform X2 [Pomacea canaliculata]|uniref:zwei Ig domain protein zig-8-like isoform X2 n=1 Tax=Pomacea canaliculata TaxID=400727 RepID=UPI000D731B2A|nr:zwei Ig domain protein zig-8-like isoform X2 [Pomacea canaliculata]
MNLQHDDDPYLPTFLPTPNNVTFLSGEEAVLQCAIENRGTRTIVWRRASEPNPLTIGEDTFVGDKRFYVRHRKHSLEWNLHIREATPQDSGVYECQVITRSRDIRQMVLLRIDDTPFIPPQKPDIQISGSQFVEKGNTLTLTCNATGFDYPPDELDWFKDGLKLTSDLRRTLRKDVSLADKTIVSKLQVARATMADAGTYVCRASDMQVTSAKVNVLNTDTVNEKRESKDQSTLWPFGSRGGVGGPLMFNAVVLLLCVALALCAS